MFIKVPAPKAGTFFFSKVHKVSESKEAFVRVGKVKDAHGIRGELFIVLFAGEAEWLGDLETMRLVPENPSAGVARELKVKSARLHKNGIIAKTEEIRDRNAAEALKGLLLEIPEDFLVSQPGESIFLREIDGFMVHDLEKGEVGKIVGFSHNGAQDLLLVETPKGEFALPFVDAFVEKIDYEARLVRMDLPVGLLGEFDESEDPESE
jgi:16S rRNA processing protein RimM